MSNLLLAFTHVKHVNGVASSMAAHILGYRGVPPCPHASQEAKEAAQEQQMRRKAQKQQAAVPTDASGRKRKHDDQEEHVYDASSEAPAPKRQELVQRMFTVVQGMEADFTSEEKAAIQAQAERAVISANLKFSVFEEPEVIEFCCMLRAKAYTILPSGKVVGGTLLEQCTNGVDGAMKKKLMGKRIGLSYV
jgi:hypothetical protein